jgi:hypothetical protein
MDNPLQRSSNPDLKAFVWLLVIQILLWLVVTLLSLIGYDLLTFGIIVSIALGAMMLGIIAFALSRNEDA